MSSKIDTEVSDGKKCAPSKQYDGESCFTLEMLVEISKAYNKKISSNTDKIELKSTSDKKTYKKYLVRELTKRLSNVCDTQICWLKQGFMKEVKPEIQKELSRNTFRPVGPQGKFTWLNTTNIDEVLKQYEAVHKDFKFFGAVPIDFQDLASLDIAKINFDELQKSGINKIGVVFNLDEHYKGGSHWVGLYNDIKNGQIYFFDSYGIKPERRIAKFMDKVEKYCNDKGIKTTKVHNKYRHQYKDSECGVYSMNFIIRLLDGETFEHITRNKTLDDEMNEHRKEYFRKSS